MRRDRRSETHRNRRLRDEGGVRDIESSGENVLIDWRGKCVSRRLDQERRVAHLFRERINDTPTNDFLSLSPETKDIVRPEAFNHVGHGFRFVRVRR